MVAPGLVAVPSRGLGAIGTQQGLGLNGAADPGGAVAGGSTASRATVPHTSAHQRGRKRSEERQDSFMGLNSRTLPSLLELREIQGISPIWKEGMDV